MKMQGKKKRFCIWLFLRGFNENAAFLGAKTMPIHATVTICGWSIPRKQLQEGGLSFEVILSHNKRCF